MEQVAEAPPVRKRNRSDLGLAVSVVLAVPLAMIVEALGFMMVEHSASWRELAVLGLFAVPLVTGWAAIAISLASRPARLRLGVAALLLLAPPALLFGVFNG